MHFTGHQLVSYDFVKVLVAVQLAGILMRSVWDGCDSSLHAKYTLVVEGVKFHTVRVVCSLHCPQIIGEKPTHSCDFYINKSRPCLTSQG